MKYSLSFLECKEDDFFLLGGKGASLARMSVAGLPVPPGFCVTTQAYVDFLEAAGLRQQIQDWQQNIDFDNINQLDAIAAEIRAAIVNASIPFEIQQGILVAYQELCALAQIPDALPVAVRSSATAEDLPDASFAGQQDTYLWTVGPEAVLDKVKRCWASLFTSRAIVYRHDHNIQETDVLMCVVVQKMVNARAAGVAMTLNPLNGDRSKIVVDSAWGLGEAVVSGEITPDHFMVDKVILTPVTTRIQHKPYELIPDPANRRVVRQEISDERADAPSLSAEELEAVCKMAKNIEKLYGCPQDVEWAVDADLPTGQNLMLLQSRPETVWSQKKEESTAAKTFQFGMEGLVNTLLNPIAGKKS